MEVTRTENNFNENIPATKAWETKRGYFPSPNEIWDYCYDLVMVEKSALSVLARHSDENNRCFPSYNTIARKLGVSRTTVIRAVKGLVKKGYLFKFHRYKKKFDKICNDSNLYIINFEKISNSGNIDMENEEIEIIEEIYNSDSNNTDTEVKVVEDTVVEGTTEEIKVVEDNIAKAIDNTKEIEVKEESSFNAFDADKMIEVLDKSGIKDNIEQNDLIKKFFNALNTRNIKNKKGYFNAMIKNYLKDKKDQSVDSIINNGVIKTKFHNFEQASSKYSEDELFQIVMGDKLSRTNIEKHKEEYQKQTDYKEVGDEDLAKKKKKRPVSRMKFNKKKKQQDVEMIDTPVGTVALTEEIIEEIAEKHRQIFSGELTEEDVDREFREAMADYCRRVEERKKRENKN